MSAKRKGSALSRWGRAKVEEVFGADLRSLAVFRAVLATLVLADITIRSTDLYAHYTDGGVLPRSVLIEGVMNRWAFSLNLMSGEFFFQVLLFVVTALAALALLAGYRTRLMTVLVWMLLLSIQMRNPLVLSSADTLLLVLIFWGMFLPLGARWSVDGALKTTLPRLSTRFLSVATVGLFLQIAFMYWFSVLLKSSDEWRVEGTAIYYALSVDQITTPIGAYLLQFPDLLEVLTFATLGLEAIGPFLLFFPFFTGPVRTGTVLAFMSFHYGIWLTMSIGIFPWLAAFCMVCFLPSWFWDRALPKLRALLPVQPDIVRALRHKAARPVRVCWLPLRARLSAMTRLSRFSIVGTAVRGDEPGSYAGQTTASPAASATKTNGPGGSARAADEQGPLHNDAEGSQPLAPRSSLVANLLAVFFLLYIFCWNLTSISTFIMPERLVPLGHFLGLGQTWSMFAPYPTKYDGWYVIPGALRGGQRADLTPVTRDDFRIYGVTWEKPEDVASVYKNERWRKYLEGLQEAEQDDQLLHFGRYICREWNARHTGAEQLEDFQIVYIKEQTLPDSRPSTPRRAVLWNHSCS